MSDSVPSSLAASALAEQVKAYARGLGFDLVGIAPASQSAYRQYLRHWLDQGMAGQMRFLAGRFEERTDPSVYLPGATAVICVAMNYHMAPAPLPATEQAHHGRVAGYALGHDYHELIKPRLHKLADWLRQEYPQAMTRVAVDTAPVMEKELAARTAIGWMGKNTCIINQETGSWLLLGEVLTTLPLPPDRPAADRCGSCRRCLDACPTGAITAPYQLDARRCISYLTIEHRQEVEPSLRRSIGDWLYGCDICQDVCPWNARAPESTEPGFVPRWRTGTLDVRNVLSWNAEEYRLELKKSAVKRVKLPILQRNAAIVRDNLAAQKTTDLPTR